MVHGACQCIKLYMKLDANGRVTIPAPAGSWFFVLVPRPGCSMRWSLLAFVVQQQQPQQQQHPKCQRTIFCPVAFCLRFAFCGCVCECVCMWVCAEEMKDQFLVVDAFVVVVRATSTHFSTYSRSSVLRHSHWSMAFNCWAAAGSTKAQQLTIESSWWLTNMMTNICTYILYADFEHLGTTSVVFALNI